MTIAFKARKNKVITGAQGLIGETGVVQATLAPQGKVFVRGEIWDAIGSAHLDAGQLVVIRQIEGLTLRVDPVSVPAQAQPSVLAH
jgi:membrane-bound serine protease (ClpP class)